MVRQGGAAAILALTAASPAPPALAQATPEVAVMNGGCGSLIVGGRDMSVGCEGRIVNAAYSNGKSSFMFMVKDLALVSFYGIDHHAKGDSAYIELTKVTFTLLGTGTDPNALPATGKCTYTNPFAGVSRITCSATTAHGRFSAAFVSDGKPPDIMPE